MKVDYGCLYGTSERIAVQHDSNIFKLFDFAEAFWFILSPGPTSIIFIFTVSALTVFFERWKGGLQYFCGPVWYPKRNSKQRGFAVRQPPAMSGGSVKQRRTTQVFPIPRFQELQHSHCYIQIHTNT
jgi:hypothetical protein